MKKYLPFLLPLLIFTVAFSLRIFYLQEIKNSPLFFHPQVDAKTYVDTAKQIAHGEFFQTNKLTFYQPPLYPLFLAFILKFFTGDLYFIHMLQFLLGALNCVFVYYLAKVVFDYKVGFLAALFACFYWPLIYFEGELLATSYAIFLDLSFLIFLYKYLSNKKGFYAFAAGTMLGLTAITVPNTLLFGWMAVPIIILLPKFSGCSRMPAPVKKRVVDLLYFGGACLFVMAPVTLYNWQVERVFMPIAHSTGLNFYIGNSPRQENTLAIRPGEEWENFISRPQQEITDRKITSAEFSDYWFRKSYLFLRNEPFHYFGNMAKKIRLFFDAHEIKRNLDIYFFKDHFSQFMRWPLLNFAVVVPFALLGVWIALKNKIRRANGLIVFAFFYFVSVILFFVTARYRLPVIPILFIFAAFAVVTLWDRLKQHHLPGFDLIVLALFFFWINTDFYNLRPNAQSVLASEAESWYYIGRALGDKAENQITKEAKLACFREAVEKMQRSIKLDSGYAYPILFCGIYSDGQAEVLLKSMIIDHAKSKPADMILAVQPAIRLLEKAENDYRLAHKTDPELGAPLYNLCLLLYRRNIIDFNYGISSRKTIKNTIVLRCDEILRLTEILLQKNRFREQEKYLRIREKALLQKQAATLVNEKA